MKRERGRPGAYRTEYAEQARRLCQLAATDEELAFFFGVSVRTISRWAREHEEFCQALKAGKEQADERVERSLFTRAVGYTYESEKLFVIDKQVVREAVTEHVPPDTTAAIFWLKNRRTEQWRDVTVQKHEVADLSEKPTSDDEWAARWQDALSLN